MRYLIIYLVAINVVTMIVYGVDKFKAKHDRWRIPESVLITLALIGGSVGALAGMFLFRHKTKHLKFTLGVPLILICQIVITILLLQQ